MKIESIKKAEAIIKDPENRRKAIEALGMAEPTDQMIEDQIILSNLLGGDSDDA